MISRQLWAGPRALLLRGSVFPFPVKVPRQGPLPLLLTWGTVTLDCGHCDLLTKAHRQLTVQYAQVHGDCSLH